MRTAGLLGCVAAATAAAAVTAYDRHHATCVTPRLVWVLGSAVGLAAAAGVGCVRRRAVLTDLRPPVALPAVAALAAVFWGVLGAATYWPPACMGALAVPTAVLVTGVTLFLLGAGLALWVVVAARWVAAPPVEATPLLVCVAASTGPVL